MTWQLFTFISVLGLSISVLLQRTLLHKHKTNPFAYAIVFQAIVGVLLLIPAFMHGFTLAGLENYLLPSLIAVICFGIGHIFYAKTLQRVEASSFSVLFATQAVWTMALGILLLHESMTWVQVVGTVLIFASVAMLAKNLRKVFADRGVVYGLITGLLFGVAVYFWSYVGRYVDGMSWAAISFIATSLVVLFIRPRTLLQLRPLLRPAVFSKLWLLGIFYGLGSLTMMFAYQLGAFAIVSPLRQTSIIVTVLLALILLPNERSNISKKLLAALICTVGVVLIII